MNLPNLLIASTYFINAAATMIDVPSEVTSDEHLKIFLKNYYKNQKIIKIFTQFDWKTNEIAKELVEMKNVFIHSDDNIEDATFYPNYGYFTATSMIDHNFLVHVSRHNGRWLVISEESINEEILKEAWDDYKILHLVLLNLNITARRYFVSFYNPFKFNTFGTRGVFKKYSLTNREFVKMIVTEIDKRPRNLYEYELTTFIETPALTYTNPVYDHKGNLVRYIGIHGEVVEAIRHSMNFKISFVKKFTDTPQIMQVSKRTSDLVRDRKIDLIGDSRFLNKSGIDKSFPLMPLTTTSIVCALPSKRESHVINIFYGFLDETATILLYISTVVVMICLYCSVKRHSFSITILDMIGIQFNISRSLQKYHRILSRFVLLLLFILNLTIVSTFQGNIISRLNIASKVKQINTLNDLVQENITILTLSPFYYLLKPEKFDSESIHDKVFKQFMFNDEFRNPETVYKISMGEMPSNIGTLIRKPQAIFLQAQYSDKGRENIHLVREPVATYPDTIHVPGWSPFVSVMNEMLLRVFEMGFFEKGHDDAEQMTWIQKLKTYKNLGEYNVSPAPITWEHLSFTFFLYLSMLGLACVVLFLEIIYYKICFIWKSNQMK